VAYDIFSEKEEVTLFHCWAHARRKFFEAQVNDAQWAQYVLGQIQLLYAIEQSGKEKGFSETELYQLRQKEALPILEVLGEW
jgi:hypothetical protein